MRRNPRTAATCFRFFHRRREVSPDSIMVIELSAFTKDQSDRYSQKHGDNLADNLKPQAGEILKNLLSEATNHVYIAVENKEEAKHYFTAMDLQPGEIQKIKLMTRTTDLKKSKNTRKGFKHQVEALAETVGKCFYIYTRFQSDKTKTNGTLEYIDYVNPDDCQTFPISSSDDDGLNFVTIFNPEFTIRTDYFDALLTHLSCDKIEQSIPEDLFDGRDPWLYFAEKILRAARADSKTYTGENVTYINDKLQQVITATNESVESIKEAFSKDDHNIAKLVLTEVESILNQREANKKAAPNAGPASLTPRFSTAD